MKMPCQMSPKFFRSLIILSASLLTMTGSRAGLFEDDEARKAILDLRQRIEFLRLEADQEKKAGVDETTGLARSLLDLQRQIELLRSDLAAIRGLSEQHSRELAEFQKLHKDQSKLLMDRMGKLEPSKVNVDGIEFLADPVERRDFESALAVFKKGEFSSAQTLFAGFVGRYPTSAYGTSALFWLGNAQYATRDYKNAVLNFRALVAKNPEHARAPEAVLSIANCQWELKDIKSTRKTLSDLIRAYPDSEAANAAKERLAALK
jgi:tol-pal system protein YbgF